MANVSTATVSMVLNGKKNISRATRDRVEKIAREQNYIPNAAARGLVGSSMNMLGIVMPDIAEPFNAAVLRAISKHIREKTSYKLVLYDMFTAQDWQNGFYDRFSTEGVDGVIHKAVEMSDEELALVKKITAPMVILENELDWADCVTVRNYDGAYQATRYLANKGHKNIALISCERASKVIQARIKAFKRALEDSGLAFDEKYVFNTPIFNAKYGMEAADYFHGLSTKPTAVFSIAGDYVACGFMARIKKLAYKVPDDFAIIGYDNLEVCEYLDPQLTTVAQPLDEMAEAAIDLLLGRIKDRDRPFETREFRAELIIRDST